MNPITTAVPPGDGSNILVVDDDPDVRRMLSDYLASHGFELSAAANRGDAAEGLAGRAIDLVILDLRLGADEGLDVLRDIRSRGEVPVIILTGHRKEEVDRVVGLELGADDYLTKPVALRELLARIRTVLRRSAPVCGTVPARGKSGFLGWVLDRRLRTLTDPTGSAVKITKVEYALLIAFLDAPGVPLSREGLLQATRVQEDVFDRSVDVQILRLRRKLEVDPSQPRIIMTARGFGYVFAAPVSTPV